MSVLKNPCFVLSVLLSLGHIYPVSGFRSVEEGKEEECQFAPVTPM